MKNTLDPSYRKDSVFSWKLQAKRVRQAILVIVFCVLFISMLGFILYGLNRGESFDHRVSVMSMPVLAIAVIIFIVTLMFMEFLVTKSWAHKHIQGWQEYAAYIAQHKEIVLNRKRLIVAGENEDLFKDVLSRDEEFLKKYDGSQHEHELEVFGFAMETWPTMVGRFFALHLGYKYWAKRMTSTMICR